MVCCSCGFSSYVDKQYGFSLFRLHTGVHRGRHGHFMLLILFFCMDIFDALSFVSLECFKASSVLSTVSNFLVVFVRFCIKILVIPEWIVISHY